MKLLALLLVGTSTGVAVTAGAMALGHDGQPARAGHVQRVTMRVMPGDRMIGSNFLLHPGPVELTVINTARHAHTFSVPRLGIDRVLPVSQSGSTTTKMTFTVGRTGVYEWFCKMPCKHAMRGEIYFLDPPPRLHGPQWAVA